MWRTFFVCFGLLLAGNASVFAQNVVPPPGFSPGQGEDTYSSPQSVPRIYSGGSDDSNSLSDPSLDSIPRSRRYGRDDVRTFRQPAVPDLALDDGPPLPIVWFRGEALYWSSKSSPMPVPVVTLGNPADTTPGALGQPGTSILLGNQNFSLAGQGGSRFTFGFSFNPAQTWGFEASYFSLASATTSLGVSASGAPGSALLSFPYFDPTGPGEAASPISLPSAFAGSALLSLTSYLQGTDLNLIHNVHSSNGVRVDLLGGFRYVNLQENLNFDTSSPNVFPNPPGFFHTFDQFSTTNNFYGGQVGVRASYDIARVFMNVTGKLAMGSTVENLAVNGATFTNIGGIASAPGGYLTQPSNIGTQTRNQFAVVPEMNLNFGVRLRPWASFIVGYSFLYISSVARPGEQVSHVINPTQSSAITNNFPAGPSGVSQPFLSVHNSDFWVQGLNFALEFRF